MVSPETIYLYVVYVDLEMIENQCPLRLTCNRCGISDLNFARSKNTGVWKTHKFHLYLWNVWKKNADRFRLQGCTLPVVTRETIPKVYL